MNIVLFLRPKATVAYLHEHNTLRQGLEKMRAHGYTAIPVIAEDGRYVGTVSEGDFLWHLINTDEDIRMIDMKETEKMSIRDLLDTEKNPPVRITASMEELLQRAMNQNFIPVVDDLGSFIGIITRKNILQCFDPIVFQDDALKKAKLTRKNAI